MRCTINKAHRANEKTEETSISAISVAHRVAPKTTISNFIYIILSICIILSGFKESDGVANFDYGYGFILYLFSLYLALFSLIILILMLECD